MPPKSATKTEIVTDPSADPGFVELRQQSQELLQLGSECRIVNAADYQSASLTLQNVKAAQKRLSDLRLSMTRPLDAAKRAIMDFFRVPEDTLARAESGIKRSMVAFQTEQDRLRREEQARLDAQARKERERIEAQAAKAAAAGKVEKAADLQDRANAVVAPLVTRETPKVAGVSTMKVWKFEIADASLLPREYLCPDEKRIAGVVRSLGAEASIPGVRVYSETIIASGSG